MTCTAEIALLYLLWIPILLTGRQNCTDQFGYGVGPSLNSSQAIMVGWGMWVVGVYLWFVLVRQIGRWLVQKSFF